MMIYVVIWTGYEGIEQLVWAGADREEAIRRLQQFRDRAVKAAARRAELEALEPEIGETEEEKARWEAAKHQTCRTMDAEFGKDAWLSGEPDRACVQGYDPVTDEFKCCCPDLDVSPSKPMFR